MKVLSYKFYNSKATLAREYIKENEGSCNIRTYREMIGKDETYPGPKNGWEFYAAAKEWRRARALPPFKPRRDGEPNNVNVNEPSQTTTRETKVVAQKTRKDEKEKNSLREVTWKAVRTLLEEAETVEITKNGRQISFRFVIGLDAG